VLIGDGRGGGGVHWGLGFSPGPKQGERRRPEPAPFRVSGGRPHAQDGPAVMYPAAGSR
jgi:hypothetical protein